MQEAEITLQFITPCLANGRRPECDIFDRSPEGAVVFLQSWWRELLIYGSRAFGRHQNTILHVRIHPNIEGVVCRYRRYWGPDKYTDHEAFLAGDRITIKAMLPDGITIDDFKTILKLAGGYKGISPYRWQDGFGRFNVK